MSSGTPTRRRGIHRVRLLGAPLLLIAMALALVALLSSHPSQATATAEGGAPALFPNTDSAVPAGGVVMLGSTEAEAGAPSGATLGLGELTEGNVVVPKLVRYVGSAGGAEGYWEEGPALPSGFQPDHPGAQPSPLEGQVQRQGYGVLAGTITADGKTRQALLVRKPAGAFEATPEVPAEGNVEPGEEPLLHGEQTLFGANRAPLIAPLPETDHAAGALLVPVYPGIGVDDTVLHWDGHGWSAEPIAIPAESSEDFKVLALAAEGPENAWLLARLSNAYGNARLALFRRVREGANFTWKPVEAEVGAGTGWAGAPCAGGRRRTRRGRAAGSERRTDGLAG